MYKLHNTLMLSILLCQTFTVINHLTFSLIFLGIVILYWRWKWQNSVENWNIVNKLFIFVFAPEIERVLLNCISFLLRRKLLIQLSCSHAGFMWSDLNYDNSSTGMNGNVELLMQIFWYNNERIDEWEKGGFFWGNAEINRK